jgi:HSP20 family protein
VPDTAAQEEEFKMIQRNVNPWKLVDAMLADFDRNTTTRNAFNSDVDVLETADSVLVHFNLPGVKPEDVNLNLEKNILSLEAKLETTLPEGAKVLYRERSVAPQIKRAIRIPVRLNSDEVQANLEHGVLTVTLKKAAESTPKRIAINGATIQS